MFFAPLLLLMLSLCLCLFCVVHLFSNSEPSSKCMRLGLEKRYNHTWLNSCEIQADILSPSGTWAISSYPVAGSINVIAVNVISTGNH